MLEIAVIKEPFWGKGTLLEDWLVRNDLLQLSHEPLLNYPHLGYLKFNITV